MAGWVNGRRTSAAIEELGKQYNSRTEKRQSCHLVKAYCGRQKGSCGGSGVNSPPVPCVHIQSRRPIDGVTDGGGGRRRGRACPGHWVRKRGTFLGCEVR